MLWFDVTFAITFFIITVYSFLIKSAVIILSATMFVLVVVRWYRLPKRYPKEGKALHKQAGVK
jgi:Flp pilus assembly protein TadB